MVNTNLQYDTKITCNFIENINELKRLVHEMSISEIAKKSGVANSTIYKHCKNWNIKFFGFILILP